MPLADVLVDDELRAVVDEVVDSGWWSMGPKVEEFEAAFAEFTETKHAFAVANGTAALHLALLAAGCGPGDEVILPSLNFVAAANAIGHTGATPVFCDITGPDDLNLDPADLEAAVTPSTKAVLLLHYGGYPCDVAAVRAFAEGRGLIVLEDAAHAPGASWHGEPCGSLGRVGCFSFFSNKNLPVGEGGMIVTDDDDLARSLRLLRSHGMTTLTWERHRGHAASYDVVERYRVELDGVAGITMPFAPRPDVLATHHLAVVVLPERRPRGEVQAALAERRIQTSVHYPPIHLFSAYREQAQRSLPVTEAIADRIVTLPLFPHMTDAQVSTVTEAVLAAV